MTGKQKRARPALFRNAFQERFSIDWDDKKRQFIILFDNELFATVEDVLALPMGFTARSVSHFYDALIGRRADLWSEQIIYGPHPFDIDHARLNGRRVAEAMMQARQDVGVYVPPDVQSVPIVRPDPTPGQLAYEADIVATPCYSDGITLRRPWDTIGLGAQLHWEKRAAR